MEAVGVFGQHLAGFMQRNFHFWCFILITKVEPNQRHLHAEQSCKFAGGIFAIDQLCQSIRLDVANTETMLAS